MKHSFKFDNQCSFRKKKMGIFQEKENVFFSPALCVFSSTLTETPEVRQSKARTGDSF